MLSNKKKRKRTKSRDLEGVQFFKAPWNEDQSLPVGCRALDICSAVKEKMQNQMLKSTNSTTIRLAESLASLGTISTC